MLHLMIHSMFSSTHLVKVRSELLNFSTIFAFFNLMKFNDFRYVIDVILQLQPILYTCLAMLEETNLSYQRLEKFMPGLITKLQVSITIQIVIVSSERSLL